MRREPWHLWCAGAHMPLGQAASDPACWGARQVFSLPDESQVLVCADLRIKRGSRPDE